MVFLEVEKAAACAGRGLETRASWAQIAQKAREIALQSALTPTRFSTDFAPLQSAARALDEFARHGVSGGQTAREAGLFAALAFAGGANFPSALVAIRRTFPVLADRDDATAALLCVSAPTLSRTWRTSAFARELRAFLRGQSDEEAVRAQWHQIEKSSLPTPFWVLGEAALEAVLTHSTWANLQNIEFPAGFVASLCKRVPTLLPPQRVALQNGFGDGRHALAALPPGTGKTLLAELFLARALGAGEGIAVFVVPYVALGRSVTDALSTHLPTGVRLQSFLGSAAREEALEWSGAQLWVATPERLDGILRAKPQVWERLRGLVIDEAHVLGDGARGARVEGLVARCKTRTKTPALLLSAAFEETQPLLHWMGEAPLCVQSKWTPTARRVALWKLSGKLEWHAELSDGSPALLGEKERMWPHPLWYCGDNWGKKLRTEPLIWENAASLAKRLHDERGGSLLCLCATRRATRQLATSLGQLWPESRLEGARKIAVALIRERHRTLLPLAELIKRGVAWHNSSLPIEVRSAIEAVIAAGQLNAVAATSTLAEGVDLPFSQTIICDWLRFEDEENGRLAQRPMPFSLFRNIAGRCGRAGAFTEGETLILENPLGPEEWSAPVPRQRWFARALSGECDGAPRSSWSHRAATRAAFESQFLAMVAENGSPDAAAFLAANCEDWVDYTQSWRRDWENDGLWNGENLTPRGRAFAALDASSSTLKTLLGVLETLPPLKVESSAQAAKLNAHLWRALRDAPESGAEIARFWNPRSRFVVSPFELESVAKMWLGGVPTERMFARLPRAQKLEGLEKWLEDEERGETETLAFPSWGGEFDRFLDFLRAGFEGWTPTIWRAAAVLAPFAGDTARAIQWNRWAARFESGVESDWAARVVKSGAAGGRSSANLVGRVWPFQSAELMRDPLCLSPLRDEQLRREAETAIQSAVKLAGGKWCYAGQSVLALRDWLWTNAGIGHPALQNSISRGS